MYSESQGNPTALEVFKMTGIAGAFPLGSQLAPVTHEHGGRVVCFFQLLSVAASFQAWPGLFLEPNKVEAVWREALMLTYTFSKCAVYHCSMKAAVSVERSGDVKALGADGSHKSTVFSFSGLTVIVSLKEIKWRVHVYEQGDTQAWQDSTGLIIIPSLINFWSVNL